MTDWMASTMDFSGTPAMLAPSVLIPVRIARTIRAAIRPYSTAVAPVSSAGSVRAGFRRDGRRDVQTRGFMVTSAGDGGMAGRGSLGHGIGGRLAAANWGPTGGRAGWRRE